MYHWIYLVWHNLGEPVLNFAGIAAGIYVLTYWIPFWIRKGWRQGNDERYDL